MKPGERIKQIEYEIRCNMSISAARDLKNLRSDAIIQYLNEEARDRGTKTKDEQTESLAWSPYIDVTEIQSKTTFSRREKELYNNVMERMFISAITYEDTTKLGSILPYVSAAIGKTIVEMKKI